MKPSNCRPDGRDPGKVPYIGISFVGIPEFGAIGTTVGQEFAAVIAGDKSVDDAPAAQAATTKAMTEAGYINRARGDRDRKLARRSTPCGNAQQSPKPDRRAVRLMTHPPERDRNRKRTPGRNDTGQDET